MPRRTKVRAKLVPAGVDIIDHDGTVLAGITNQDAVDLGLSMSAQFARFTHRAWLDAGKPIRSKRTASKR